MVGPRSPGTLGPAGQVRAGAQAQRAGNYAAFLRARLILGWNPSYIRALRKCSGLYKEPDWLFLARQTVFHPRQTHIYYGAVTEISDIASRDGLPRRLSREDCLVWMRELVAEGGRVTFSEHAFERMEERDITTAQVFQVLRRGDIIDGPTYSTKHQNWEFLIQADAGGEEVTVKAAIEIESLMGQVVVVVTVF